MPLDAFGPRSMTSKNVIDLARHRLSPRLGSGDAEGAACVRLGRRRADASNLLVADRGGISERALPQFSPRVGGYRVAKAANQTASTNWRRGDLGKTHHVSSFAPGATSMFRPILRSSRPPPDRGLRLHASCIGRIKARSWNSNRQQGIVKLSRVGSNCISGAAPPGSMQRRVRR